MSNLVLEVEVQPGTHIRKAAFEVAALAKKLEVNIRFNFNGIDCFVVAGWSEADILGAYERARNSDRR